MAVLFRPHMHFLLWFMPIHPVLSCNTWSSMKGNSCHKICLCQCCSHKNREGPLYFHVSGHTLITSTCIRICTKQACDCLPTMRAQRSVMLMSSQSSMFLAFQPLHNYCCTLSFLAIYIVYYTYVESSKCIVLDQGKSNRMDETEKTVTGSRNERVSVRWGKTEEIKEGN